MNKGYAPRGIGRIPEENEGKRDNKGIFLRLARYVLHEWKIFFLALILTLLSNHLALLGPSFSGSAIDAIVAPGGVDFPTVWQRCR